MSMIEVRDLRKSYQLGDVAVEILKGVHMNVEDGEMLSIVGTSGCGKSTLMNILGFLDVPSGGDYMFEGKAASAMNDFELSSIRNEKIGFVFQQFNLLSRLTAQDNVALPLMYGGVPLKERMKIAEEMLDRVGMAERMHHRPTELSGGQQQRVAIARAIAGSPKLILADEPTGALDTRVGQEIMELFLELNRERGITTVIITHDPGVARQCGRVLRMQDGTMRTENAPGGSR